MNNVHVNTVYSTVIVIGAGLGGLTLAQGLRRAGVDVRVYEQDRGAHARFQGYRIGLRGPGRRALASCLPERLHPLLDATTGDISGPGLVVDDQLRELGRGPGFDEETRVVDRHVLRHLLLAGLGDRVHFGRRLARYEEDGDSVRAVFEHGGTAAGEVLVGADGGGSAVRRQLLPGVRLVESDLCGALGRTTLTERFAHLVPGAGTMVKGRGTTLMLGRMPFPRPPAEAAAELAPDVALPAAESYLRWVLLVPSDHPAARPGSAARPGAERPDARRVVLELIDGWHPDLVELIRAGDADNSIVGRAMVMERPVEPWPQGRVTLLGDAAHLMLATGGSGANTALADAELLRRILVEVAAGRRSTAAALDEYQADLLGRGNAAVRESKEALRQFV